MGLMQYNRLNADIFGKNFASKLNTVKIFCEIPTQILETQVLQGQTATESTGTLRPYKRSPGGRAVLLGGSLIDSSDRF